MYYSLNAIRNSSMSLMIYICHSRDNISRVVGVLNEFVP
jgi:hypothetical protein